MSKARHAVSMVGVMALVMSAPIFLSMSAASAAKKPVMMDGYRCSVVSTHAGAVLHGSPNAVLCALGANSKAYAGNGYEVLIAGPGRDTLVASSSHTSRDILIGGSGNDTLIGGAGTDTLIGGSGNNTLRAGSGTELLYAGIHTNKLLGGSGTNTLTGGPGKDVLHAGNGPTTLFAGSGTQQLTGGRGHDYFLGGVGHTAIHAGSGTHDVFLAANSHSQIDCGSASSSVVVGSKGAVQASDCKGHGNDEESYQAYEGVVSATSGAQISVTYSETNDAAKTWLAANGSPQPATFDLTGATIKSDTGSIVPAVNDCALVLATAPTSGTVLPAVFVELHTCEGSDTGLQRYHGTVTDVTGSQMTVAYTEANDTAQAWLAANGNPTTVTFDISTATIKSETGSSSPAVNDCVHVSANTPASGLVLPAVRVSIHHCDGEDSGLQGYRGQVTGVSGSQITLTYTDANDAAQAWLNANGNPVSVTFDISSATIESSTGSQTPAQGDCAEVSATTPASGLILPAVTVELHVCGHGGDGEGDGDGGGDHASLQRYRGTVTGVSGSQVTVTYSDANDTAQTWLDANGDPTTVTFDISAATVESTTGSTTPAVNDCIGVSATTPASGLILPAVSVVLHTCETQDGSYQIYGGTVTNVTGSQMTVTYSFTNDNANTWLAANGNPTSVTFDLTGATIDSHTGSPTPNVNDCAGVAATTPASGLVLPAVFVELFTCGSGPGGGE